MKGSERCKGQMVAGGMRGRDGKARRGEEGFVPDLRPCCS